jgi:hypothetical protein
MLRGPTKFDSVEKCELQPFFTVRNSGWVRISDVRSKQNLDCTPHSESNLLHWWVLLGGAACRSFRYSPVPVLQVSISIFSQF